MKQIILFLIVGIGIFLYLVFYSASDSWEITNSTPSGEKIICFGDSLTFGTGAQTGMSYPSQLSEMIQQPIVNAGIPGDTTATALARLEKDVLQRNPKIILITLGGNDLKNRVSKETAFKNFKTIINTVHSKGALVVVGGINIPFYGRGYAKLYKQLCIQTGSILIPNVYEGIMGNKALMSDPIHPNTKGYTVMAEKFYTVLEPYL